MKILTEREAEDFLEKNKFPVVKRVLTKNIEQALKEAKRLQYPVALKVSSKEIMHKSEVNGVKTDIRNEEELKKSYKDILTSTKKYKIDGILVQKFVKGRYLLLGIKKTKAFNHVIALGSGGIYTEILKDITFRIPPINKNDAKEMIEELKSYKILKGARNQPSIDFEKLINVILKTSDLIKKHKNIQELDINPLIINEKEAVVVDARIVLE